MIRIQVGDLHFRARFEEGAAPRSCAVFRAMLPFRAHLVQARWSGEAGWIPLGNLSLDVGPENATHQPRPGALLLHPADVSETEILFPYGQCTFASKFGPLTGNHFLTITHGTEQLEELGRRLLWEGAQPVVFDDVPAASSQT